MPYSTDLDLLRYEPFLFKDAVFASKTLLSGVGTLNGNSFTVASGSLQANQIEPGMAITLTGIIAGTFPIVAITSDTELTLGALYDQLDPGGALARAVPAGSGVNVSFVIRSFTLQAQVVGDLILHSCGVDPARANVLNPSELIRVCVLGTLQMIYSALSALAGTTTIFGQRAELYERLYRRALRHAVLEIDTNDDGKPNRVVRPGMLELICG